MIVPADPRPTAAPPETLAGLRALAAAIEAGRSGGGITLGTKAQAALAGMIGLVGDPALLSITTLARHLGVNASTLTRLARALGYPGFPALQRVLLSASMTTPGEAFYSRHSQAALEAVAGDAGGSGSPHARAARLCRENQANIGSFIDDFDESGFTAAATAIMTAPRVAVHGIRQFRAVAGFLTYGLGMIRADVTLLDGAGLGTAEGLAMLGPGGVLVSTSCAPYSAQVVAVAEAARDCGLGTIALTDGAGSPLVRSATLGAILVPHDSSFLSNSIGAFVVAVECLINACAALQPAEVRGALADRDRMIARLGIERDR